MPERRSRWIALPAVLAVLLPVLALALHRSGTYGRPPAEIVNAHALDLGTQPCFVFLPIPVVLRNYSKAPLILTSMRDY